MAEPTIVYPLQQVLAIKNQRLEQAELLLKKRKEELKREQDKLIKIEEARDKVLKHQNDKIAQMYAELDGGTTSEKILQMRRYLQVVKEKLAEAEKKVKVQKDEIKKAETNVELARQDMLARRLAVDKMDIHKKQWTIFKREELRVEFEKEQDEVGNILYLKNKDRWS